MISATTSTLETLRHLCAQGESSLGDAATRITDAKVRNEIELLSRQHGQFAEDLHDLLQIWRPASEEPSTDGNAWRKQGAAPSGVLQDDQLAQLLAVCESNEQRVIEAYVDALQKHLPDEIEPLVESQWRALEYAQQRIRRLMEGMIAPA